MRPAFFVLMPKLKPSRRAIFTELTTGNLKAGKPFDGLAPLDNVLDMYGQAVTITAGDIDAYLANTLAMIESTRTEGGELVGLPIDADNHNKGDAAGWIVGAQKVGEALIRLVPRWTKIGIELIGEKIRAGFSPTLDLENKAILGGSLTNWPASRNKKSHWLLRPIELSTGMFTQELAQELQMDKEQILAAFNEAMAGMEGMGAAEGVEVTDEYVAFTLDGVMWRVPYTVTDEGAVTFAAKEEWEEVTAPAPVMAEAMGRHKRPATRKEKGMTVNLDAINAQIAQLSAAVAALAGKQKAPVTAAPPPAITGVDLSEVFNLSGVTEQGRAQVQAWATHQAELVRQQVELAQAQALLQIQRDNRYTELAQRLTGGTADAPRGLKGTTAEELKKHLMALPSDEAKYFGELLEGVVKGGLVEFSELGHGKQAKGRLELPAEYVPAFKKTIAAGNSAEMFFAANTELGNPADYNLAKFQSKEK